ncbi:hypothetical protein KEM48_006774 [Puccinia striiformis f. sp. tritici PST-130]|nr:hypothetical protein KEM48_006774 [Puccinia striiformis f. sp. tritici PST-130]
MPQGSSSKSRQQRGSRTKQASNNKTTRHRLANTPGVSKVNTFGKRSFGHVAAQAFPVLLLNPTDVTTLSNKNVHKILKQQKIGVKLGGMRPTLARQYRSMIDQATCPNPKRVRLRSLSADPDFSRVKLNSPVNDLSLNQQGLRSPRENASDQELDPANQSDHSTEVVMRFEDNISPAPSSDKRAYFQEQPSIIGANRGEPVRDKTSTENDDEMDEDQPLESSVEDHHFHHLRNNASPATSTARRPQASTSMRQSHHNRLIFASDDEDETDAMDEDRPLYDNKMDEARLTADEMNEDRQSDDDMLDEDQQSDGEVEAYCLEDGFGPAELSAPPKQAPNGARQSMRHRVVTMTDDDEDNEDQVQPQHRRSRGTAHYNPPEPEDVDELADDESDAARVYSDEDERSDGEETDYSSEEWQPQQWPAQEPANSTSDINLPHLSELPLARLRAMVKEYGLPYSKLNRSQLLVVCEEFSQQQQASGTQSGRNFRNHSPLMSPRFTDQDPELEAEADCSGMRSDEHDDISCHAMHRRTAAEINDIKKTQQLTTSQIDEALRLIQLLRDELKSKQKPQYARKVEIQRPPLCNDQVCASFYDNIVQCSSDGRPRPKFFHVQLPKNSDFYVHEAATSQQVKIIVGLMQQTGVRRFAPDFLEPPNTSDNKFLWDLAVDIFCELIECGEYVGIPVSLQDRQIIGSEMRKYVREMLARRYKKEHLWTLDEQTDHTSNKKRKSRRLHLVVGRLDVADDIGGLECLYPAIKAATSEDETDYEEAPLKNRKRGRKHCNILQVPWRSSKLTEIFIQLDEINAHRKQNSLSKPSGPPPRIRCRVEHASPGSVKPSSGLPENCYSSRWLAKLSAEKHRDLKPSPRYDVDRISQALASVPAHNPCFFHGQGLVSHFWALL